MFGREPDGSYRWMVLDERTDEVLQAGTSDDWDGAKLDAVLDLLPPWEDAP